MSALPEGGGRDRTTACAKARGPFRFSEFSAAFARLGGKGGRLRRLRGRVFSAGSNDAVWKFIQKTFEEQGNITEANVDEKLKAIATASGANADEVAACAVKPDTKARIEASVALGRSVGVNGTPTLFINGRNVPGGAPVDVLKKIVDFESSQK